MTLKTYKGGCHCGNIQFEADIDLANGTNKCNCTYCLKTRAWSAFLKPKDFRLKKAEGLVRYHAHPQAPVKHHCAKCGVHTHATGDADYMGGPFVSVSVHVLDNVEPELLVAAPVKYSDGLHNNWQNPPAETRYL